MFVSKVGTAITFVLTVYFGRGSLSGRSPLFALVWWLMFAIGKTGQAIGAECYWREAVVGIISETVYLALSAHVTDWLIGLG